MTDVTTRLNEMKDSALGRVELSDCSTEKALMEYVQESYEDINRLIDALMKAIEQRDAGRAGIHGYAEHVKRFDATLLAILEGK